MLTMLIAEMVGLGYTITFEQHGASEAHVAVSVAKGNLIQTGSIQKRDAQIGMADCLRAMKNKLDLTIKIRKELGQPI